MSSIGELVDSLPPLTDAQAARLFGLLYGTPVHTEAETPASESEDAKAIRAAETEARKLAASIMACDVCDLAPEVHIAQSSNGHGFHAWVPGRAKRVLAGSVTR